MPYDIFHDGRRNPGRAQLLQVPALPARHGAGDDRSRRYDHVRAPNTALKTPWAENGIGFNIGAEYRKEASDFLPDIEISDGRPCRAAAAPTPPVNGQFDVRELFAETQIPIVEHNFIDLLQISAGYRYSSYKVADNTFSTNTYKVGAGIRADPRHPLPRQLQSRSPRSEHH